MTNHYDRLGVSPHASPEQLRQAFRRAARDAHPDRHGNAFSDRMAAINDAWHVLGDPRRRQAYDETLALTTSIFDAAPNAGRGAWPPPADPPMPAAPVTVGSPARRRSKWRLVLAIEAVAVIAVIVGSMLHTSAKSVPDGVLRTGDCVMLNTDDPPVEVSCVAVHNAVVERVVPFGTSCPADRVPYRNRAGRVCMVQVSSDVASSPATAGG